MVGILKTKEIGNFTHAERIGIIGICGFGGMAINAAALDSRAIRAEEGNLRYDYFFSKDDPETVLLIDSWASQKALDAHHATPMMKTISSLREKYDLTMRAERYYRADEDLTANDAKFIKGRPR